MDCLSRTKSVTNSSFLPNSSIKKQCKPKDDSETKGLEIRELRAMCRTVRLMRSGITKDDSYIIKRRHIDSPVVSSESQHLSEPIDLTKETVALHMKRIELQKEQLEAETCISLYTDLINSIPGSFATDASSGSPAEVCESAKAKKLIEYKKTRFWYTEIYKRASAKIEKIDQQLNEPSGST